MSHLLRLRLRSKSEKLSNDSGDADVAKLFFDAFSKRVSTVEEGLKILSSEISKLKLSTDRSQVSDLVLLERLQKAEGTLRESLAWIRRVAEAVMSESQAGGGVALAVGAETRQPIVPAAAPPIAVRRAEVTGGELGTLPSITTPTELQVLTLLAEEGPKSAPEIGRLVGRSREHSARLMKRLYEEGYVRRDQARMPFRYSLVERVRAGFKKAETKDEAPQEATVPPA